MEWEIAELKADRNVKCLSNYRYSLISSAWNTAAKWLEVFFLNKKKPKQTSFLYMRGLCMPGEPFFTWSTLSIGVELIIFMLLLLQLATCRNDTSPKHSCQKFWTLYLHGASLAASHSHNSTRKRVFFGDYLALRWGVGVEGFLLFPEAAFPWRSLAAAPREYTPCWQFTSRGLHSSWLTNNKQKTN